jgi:hypothetical protein
MRHFAALNEFNLQLAKPFAEEWGLPLEQIACGCSGRQSFARILQSPFAQL